MGNNVKALYDGVSTYRNQFIVGRQREIYMLGVWRAEGGRDRIAKIWMCSTHTKTRYVQVQYAAAVEIVPLRFSMKKYSSFFS